MMIKRIRRQLDSSDEALTGRWPTRENFGEEEKMSQVTTIQEVTKTTGKSRWKFSKKKKIKTLFSALGTKGGGLEMRGRRGTGTDLGSSLPRRKRDKPSTAQKGEGGEIERSPFKGTFRKKDK